MKMNYSNFHEDGVELELLQNGTKNDKCTGCTFRCRRDIEKSLDSLCTENDRLRKKFPNSDKSEVENILNQITMNHSKMTKMTGCLLACKKIR